MIVHVQFVSIPTTDQDRALAFYTEKLGFKLVTDQPFSDTQRWIELRIGNADTQFVLFRSDNSHERP
jgi:catechol 2,3-dioxygenase-like lactoylglutathione lyase family enzyme